MFVSVALSTPTEAALTVPTEAVIQTGRRAIVMLADGNGRFRPVDVDTGMESGGRTQIKRGLIAGQKVVVSGQFLVDSEANLKATTVRMEDAPPAAGIAGAEHVGQGKIEAVGNNAVTLSHGPISSMQWGAMTMDFGDPATGLPAGLKPGQIVTFAFTMNQDGRPVLTRIEPTDKPMAASAMENKP
jgi:Cu(I)/Ag(I) efflux system membrane fusion protein